jgi:PAS domain S-box-containing protein
VLEFLKRLFRSQGAVPSKGDSSAQSALVGRGRAEEGRRQSEEHFEQLVAGVRDYAIFRLDRQGNVLTWNAGAERLKGYRAEEIIGQHFSRFYPKDSVTSGWPEHELRVAAATGRFEDEGWRIRKDGTRFWANVVISALRDESGEVRGFLKISRDLTDRKQAEEKLRLSEERFRLMIEGVKDYAIFMLDPQGRVATWNAGAQRLKGYTAEEIIGQHFSRFYPKEEAESDKPARELEIATTTGKYEEEGWRMRKDGSLFWASVVLTALRDESGVLRGFGKVTRDMTERKQAEESARRLLVEEAARLAAEANAVLIREQRERLRVTLHSIGDGVIVTDAESRVTMLNPIAQALTGWSQEAAAGTPLTTVFHILNEQSRQQVENPVAKALREGHVVGLANHSILIAKDGTERQIDDSASPIQNEQGQTIGVVLVFRDVAQRRAAEKALRISEERLRLALAAGHMGVWEWDLGTNAIWWSEGLEIIHGLKPGTFAGTLEAFQQLVHSDDRESVRRALSRVVDLHADYDVEFRTVAPDGSIRWIAGKGKLFRDGGTPLRMVGVGADITDRKRAEEGLREADRRKNEFLATLAHELRNPLAPLRTGLQVLRLAEDQAAQENARAMMERQLAQMVRLIDDLLDVSRISRNKLELRKARITLAAVLENAVETARPLIDTKGQILTVNLPPEPIYLDADLTRLAQVFWNLLNNSAKYTDPGGRIELFAQSNGGEVTVTVRDTGIGIPVQALSGLFNMFSQVDHSLERSQGGLGIGLALVKGLVEMHAGTVEARSAGTGKGSEFVVRLPAAPIDDEEATAPVVEPLSGSARRRILIVDDNRDGAASLGMMLTLQGHDTRTAHDGLEALELAEVFRPDVVLLDIGLPKLNGYEAARRIREQPWGRDMVLIAVTGWGQEEDKRRSMEAGFNLHMVKPVAPTDLETLLASLERRT